MLDPWHLVWLFGTGLAAGFVDSIAGGGGLITVPMLIATTGDTKLALGTNKLQACFGSGSAAWHYAGAGTVPLRDCKRGFLITFLGAAAGSWILLRLSSEFLKHFIPWLLIAVAIYSLLRPRLGDTDAPPRMKRAWFDLLFGVGIGFYDGFFGPGTGTFWAIAFVLVMGFNFTKATGYTKVMNFASNLASLLIFVSARQVLFVPGIVMGGGQWLGARLGSRTVVKHGARFIRPIFIAVVLAITAKLLRDLYWK